MDTPFKVYLEKLWSGDVQTHFTPKEGIFTKSAEEIANYLHKNSNNLKQAISRVNFYVNRAGENISEKGKFETVKALLRKKFGTAD